jgi:hypothetical protein
MARRATKLDENADFRSNRISSLDGVFRGAEFVRSTAILVAGFRLISLEILTNPGEPVFPPGRAATKSAAFPKHPSAILICDKLLAAGAAGRFYMNKYEQRSLQERKSTMKVGLSLFAAAAILLFVALVLTGYIGSMPKQPWQKATLIVAAVALVVRQLMRVTRKTGKPKVDPQSALHLNE